MARFFLISTIFLGLLLFSLTVLPRAEVQAQGLRVVATNTSFVHTRTPTSTPALPCSPANEVISNLPYYKNGVGTFCLRMGGTKKPLTYMHSWLLTSLTVNGWDYTNMYVPAASLPPKIGSLWYIRYVGSFTSSHFEAN